MDLEFVDRILTCSDCGGEFIFTAGEQLFFLDKQFKNDPKRCKPCKSRRGARGAVNPETGAPAAAGISRTETRTECSGCGVETTVPFKPTQGRPVFCRQCYKNKMTASPTVTQTTSSTADLIAAASSHASELKPPSHSVSESAQAN
jgi:CxxC-x17-CxxC domain-containing protein